MSVPPYFGPLLLVLLPPDVLPPQAAEEALVAKWRRLREIRAVVIKRIEDLRAAGQIGSSLQAEVVVEAGLGDRRLLESLGDDLKFVFITSRAQVAEGTDEGLIQAQVLPSPHDKCERCWHYRPDVGSKPGHATICARCVSNLEGPGEVRRHA